MLGGIAFTDASRSCCIKEVIDGDVTFTLLAKYRSKKQDLAADLKHQRIFDGWIHSSLRGAHLEVLLCFAYHEESIPHFDEATHSLIVCCGGVCVVVGSLRLGYPIEEERKR